jgi:hypothetical protein
MLWQQFGPHSSTEERILKAQKPGIISSKTLFFRADDAPVVVALSVPKFGVGEHESRLPLLQIGDNPTRKNFIVASVLPAEHSHEGLHAKPGNRIRERNECSATTFLIDQRRDIFGGHLFA